MCGIIFIGLVVIIVGGIIINFIGGKIGDYLAPEDKNISV